MLKQLVFTRGLPGSGKSTLAKEYKTKHKDSCFLCSTDEYWMRPDSEYDFNWELLGKSHAWNQRRVEKIMDEETNFPLGDVDIVIVVDNTNMTFKEMSPYIKHGIRYGFDITFREPTTEWAQDVEECFKRNTHGVPYATMLKMHKRWEANWVVVDKLKVLVATFDNIRKGME